MDESRWDFMNISAMMENEQWMRLTKAKRGNSGRKPRYHTSSRGRSDTVTTYSRK